MKPLTFEEWMKECYGTGSMLKSFDLARQGTIPEDEAVRIPPVSEWPEESVGIRVVYTFNSVDFAFGHEDIAIIKRPSPAWTPKVGEAVFNCDHIQVEVQMVVGVYDRCIVTIDNEGKEGEVKLKDLKPFNPAYIGKPWDEIPGF